MRNVALLLAVLPTAAVRLGGTPAMQVYTPLDRAGAAAADRGQLEAQPETAGEAAALLKLVAANQRAMETSGRRDVPDVALFPPFPFLPLALELLRGTSVKVGAQNIGLQTKGAFTGEVSASQVASLGCECVLLGRQRAPRALRRGRDDQREGAPRARQRAGAIALRRRDAGGVRDGARRRGVRGAAQEGTEGRERRRRRAHRRRVRAGVGDRHRAGGDARAGAGGARGDPPRTRRDLRRRNGAADRHPVRRLRDARDHR